MSAEPRDLNHLKRLKEKEAAKRRDEWDRYTSGDIPDPKEDRISDPNHFGLVSLAR